MTNNKIRGSEYYTSLPPESMMRVFPLHPGEMDALERAIIAHNQVRRGSEVLNLDTEPIVMGLYPGRGTVYYLINQK